MATTATPKARAPRKATAPKATPAKAAPKADATPAPKAAPAKPVRVVHASEVAAVKAAVSTVARKAADDSVALALRALLRQSYRPAGATVLWAQPEHRTAHGAGTPDNGQPMRNMVAYVGVAIAALPKASDAQATDERKAATAALAALAKALA